MLPIQLWFTESENPGGDRKNETADVIILGNRENYLVCLWSSRMVCVMKKILFVCIITCLLPLLESCSTVSLSGYPDLTKAFPQNRFLGVQQTLPTRKLYSYMTMKNFLASKTEFEQFIGSDWAYIDGDAKINKEYQQILRKSKSKLAQSLTVSGSSVYLSPRYPNKRILLIHVKTDSLTSFITVIEETL